MEKISFTMLPGGKMALLIVNLDKQIGNAAAWRDTFAAQISGGVLSVGSNPRHAQLRPANCLTGRSPDPRRVRP